MTLLALDIGGANLKAADGQGFTKSCYFPLWVAPERLPVELAALLADAPPAAVLVATMTGELADCFVTKAEGVLRIVGSLVEAAGNRKVLIYLTDGSLVFPADAISRPLEAAASNWHVLARFAGRYGHAHSSLLVDIGSTTCDLISIVERQPATTGRTDPERLSSGELLYTGVQRSPICAVLRYVPWRGKSCRLAQELFAQTWDAYLTTGDLPEEPCGRHTADGRPATREAAHDRLARAICADRTMFDKADAMHVANAVAAEQLKDVAAAIKVVTERMPGPPASVLISGQGEFLARRAAEQALPGVQVLSLSTILGAEVSRVAPAHALAVLAREAGLA